MVKVKHGFWSELKGKLGNLAALQLIVCPSSEIHVDESVLKHDLRDRLQEMYRSFGGNHRFRSPNEIEQSQFLRAMKRYLGTDDFNPVTMRREGFCGNPHCWTTRTVFTDFPVNETWVADLRNRKQAIHSEMQSQCDYWKANPTSFDEDVNKEMKGFAQTVLEAYRFLAPATFAPGIPPGVQHVVILVHLLATEVKSARPNIADPVSEVEAFFASPFAQQTPFLDITCNLWATIAQRVRSKKGSRQPKQSDTFDVTAISHFAPYCDAMFVDNEFRGMAYERNVDLFGKYGVRLFSYKTRNEFLTYLDGILASMSDAHIEGLSIVHPHLAPALPHLRRTANSHGAIGAECRRSMGT